MEEWEIKFWLNSGTKTFYFWTSENNYRISFLLWLTLKLRRDMDRFFLCHFLNTASANPCNFEGQKKGWSTSGCNWSNLWRGLSLLEKVRGRVYFKWYLCLAIEHFKGVKYTTFISLRQLPRKFNLLYIFFFKNMTCYEKLFWMACLEKFKFVLKSRQTNLGLFCSDTIFAKRVEMGYLPLSFGPLLFGLSSSSLEIMNSCWCHLPN